MSMEYRKEKDALGEKLIPSNQFWGIHTLRAIENFNISGNKVPLSLIRAIILVKKACCQTNNELNYLKPDISDAILQACDEVIENKLNDQFPTDALQGGAGTSTNMNVNEVIANKALELLGYEKGSFQIINPIEHINLHQSTNDVYPTALNIAAIYAIRDLSKQIELLQGAFQAKEKEFAEIVTIGRTELQDAVPMTLGAIFSGYSEAISRDRWRTFKCEERLRIVNIGGTAVGTGLTAPRNYIFLVIEKLRLLTGLGIARAEQVIGQTSNADVYSEVSGILAAHAVNLGKIARDLRLMHYLDEIKLPEMQAGSSIMPGKINPVISEAIIIATMKVRANISMINEAASQGTLQINEFLPLIAYALLESLEILTNCCKIFAEHINKIEANSTQCKKKFDENITIITAFLPNIGYEKAEKLLQDYKSLNRTDFRKFLEENLGLELAENVLSPQNLMSLGYKTQR